MANIPTYESREFQAAPLVPPPRDNSAYVWQGVMGVANRLMSAGNSMEDEQAKKDGLEAGLKAQTEAGGGELLKAEDGLFGKTIHGTAYDKGAEIAFAAQKGNELDKGLYEIQKTYGHDPAKFSEEVASFRQTFLAGVPLAKQALFGQDFDKNALGEQKIVDRAAEQQKQAENLAAINGRLDTAMTSMNNLIVKDPTGNAERIAGYAAEIDAILDAASQPTADRKAVISADRIQEYRTKSDVMLAKNFAYAMFNRGDANEKKVVVDTLRNGDFRLPALGKDGNVLVEKGREIPIEDARKIASELEESARKSDIGDKLALAQLKLSLTEQTSATTATMKPHPNIAQTITMAESLGRPDLLDDIRKAKVALSVTTELRPLAIGSGEEIQASISDRMKAIQSGTSKDVYRDSEYVEQARKLLASKESAIRDGKESEWLYERGLIGATPKLNVNDQNSIGTARTARLETEAATGRPQPIMDDAFMKSAKDTLENGTAADKTKLLGFVASLPRTADERQRMFNEMGKSNPELGQLSYYFAAVNPDGSADPVKRQIAADALAGLDRYKANPADTIKEQSAYRTIDKLLIPYVKDGNQMAGMRRMVFGLMVEDGSKSGKLYKADGKEFNETEAKKAVLRVIGAADEDIRATRVPSINSTPVVPFERGMPESKMRLLWKSIDDDTLKSLNGGKLPIDGSGMTVTAEQMRDRGRLRYTGVPGEYVVVYTDPRRDSDAYPSTDPDTPLLSGNIRNGRAEPFRFRYDATTKDMLMAATRKVKQIDAVAPEMPL